MILKLNEYIDRMDIEKNYKLMVFEKVNIDIEFLEGEPLKGGLEESYGVMHAHDLHEYLKSIEIASLDYELDLSISYSGVYLSFELETADFLTSKPLKIFNFIENMCNEIHEYIEEESFFDNTETKITVEIDFER